MKAGEVSVVQYDTEHGGLRVLPLQSVTDIARMEVLRNNPHGWVCVGYATEESKAQGQMAELKERMKAAAGERE